MAWVGSRAHAGGLLDGPGVRHRDATEAQLDRLIAERGRFGITRVGSITGLDRIGLPVAQAVRPLSLSNSVSQGKGLTPPEAMIAAVMEAIETWAAERIPAERSFVASAEALGGAAAEAFEPLVDSGTGRGWRRDEVRWIEGLDVLSGETRPVPLALVDTAYTAPSPHPPYLPRSTTGLASGSDRADAFIHAGLEWAERHAVAAARRRHGFFDDCQIDLSAIRDPTIRSLLGRFAGAGLVAAAWHAPAGHGLPVLWAQLMPAEPEEALMPLPADGFGCAVDPLQALRQALLEAGQARLAAIAGAREDIDRDPYREPDRRRLRSWADRLAAPPRALSFETLQEADAATGKRSVAIVLAALRRAGPRAAVAVDIGEDPELGVAVLRLVVAP